MRRTEKEKRQLYKHTLTVLKEVSNEKGRDFTFKAKSMAERVGLSSWVLSGQLEQLIKKGHVKLVYKTGKRSVYKTLFKKEEKR